MSVATIGYYRVVCDWPGCEAVASRDWRDARYAIEQAIEDDWWTGREGDRHYCHDHLAAWVSDQEAGEPLPQSSYLLIHDGDTGDHFDGKVTMVVVPQLDA